MTQQTGETVSAVNAVCARALEDYLTDPWRWPRESDLIVDLVTLIREELRRRGEPERVAATPLLNAWYDLIGSTKIQVPRVRTELKLASLGDDANDSKGDRTDIGILRAAGATIHFQPHGVRDVTLRVNIEGEGLPTPLSSDSPKPGARFDVAR